jgi:hypothetical protein
MTEENKNLSNYAGLNFYDVKYNLIDYLKTQSEFSDFNFEGSNLSIILDILSYNTSQQGFYNTMVANEMFIDRATKRSSVVSLAKLLGYTPGSFKAAKAKVLVTVDAEDVPSGGILPRGTVFGGFNTDGISYNFTNPDSYVFYPYEFENNTEQTGNILKYYAGPIDLLQGTYNRQSFNALSSDERFTISDKNADRTTFRVFVLRSITNTSGSSDIWTECTDITTVDGSSKVFFLEENAQGELVISFGDGVLGKKLENGNVVIVEFLSTLGSAGNGIGANDTTTRSSFEITDGNFQVLTVEPSNSGRDREQSTSIKKNAVRNYTSKQRAVTVNDYEGLVLAFFNENVAVRCWGGEDNDPPYYGKVFISARPVGRTSLTTAEKNNLVSDILKTKNIVGVDVVIVDPEVVYVDCNVRAYFDRTTTNLSASTVSEIIKKGITNYFEQNLVEFGDSIFSQDVENEIKSYNTSIKGVEVNFILEKRLTPEINTTQRITVDFQNKLYHPYAGYQSIVSTNPFQLLVNDSFVNHIIEDDGNGKLILKRFLNGTYRTIDSNYGSINYETGKLELFKLKVQKFVNKSYISLKVVPDTNNIFTKRNSILSFEPNAENSLKIVLTEVKPQTVTGGSGSVITRPENY